MMIALAMPSVADTMIGAQHVGQDVTGDDAPPARADAASGGHELALPERQHVAPHDARGLHPAVMPMMNTTAGDSGLRAEGGAQAVAEQA